jgi:hypothetical protein
MLGKLRHAKIKMIENKLEIQTETYILYIYIYI